MPIAVITSSHHTNIFGGIGNGTLVDRHICNVWG